MFNHTQSQSLAIFLLLSKVADIRIEKLVNSSVEITDSLKRIISSSLSTLEVINIMLEKAYTFSEKMPFIDKKFTLENKMHLDKSRAVTEVFDFAVNYLKLEEFIPMVERTKDINKNITNILEKYYENRYEDNLDKSF